MKNHLGGLKYCCIIPISLNSSHYRKCYICFKNEKDRQDGIEKLNGEKLKKEILTAKIAQPAKDNMVQRERNEEPEKPDLRSTEEKLLDAVAPWRKISYPKQVQDKTLKESGFQNQYS